MMVINNNTNTHPTDKRPRVRAVVCTWGWRVLAAACRAALMIALQGCTQEAPHGRQRWSRQFALQHVDTRLGVLVCRTAAVHVAHGWCMVAMVAMVAIARASRAAQFQDS